MIEAWERRSNRKQPEYNPEDCCEECGRESGQYLLHETEDGRLLCRECYNHYLEEEKDEINF